ncbi:sigma-70 family RNA polymerase sigma factor [Humibacter antri]
MSLQADLMAQTAETHRRELIAYCYRMTGSLHDAQDLVQETMVRAWRSAETYDRERGSVRTWLYRIATNVCLTVLADARRRVLPAELSGPSSDAEVGHLTQASEIAWLEPFPDSRGSEFDPAAAIEQRESIRLAFVAALQHLAPLQRAVLVLRDVLAFSASDAAELLDTTPAAVNSALQRARARVEEVAPNGDDANELSEPQKREFLDRYVRAFETHDIQALTRILCDDVLLQMPPQQEWFAGRDPVAAFLATGFARGGTFRMVPTAANGCPAFGLYRRRDTPCFEPLNLQVVTLAAGGVARIDAFQSSGLFAAFEMPERLAV